MSPIRRVLMSTVYVGVAAVALVACRASAPARFYTLNADAAMPAAAPLAGRSIVVGVIQLPQYLDRPQMVIRGEQGELRLMEFQRWAEPLQSSFQRVFTEDLMIAGGTQQVVAMPIPQSWAADYEVAARVSRFDIDQAGQAVLIVQWFALDGAGKAIVKMRQSTYQRSATVPLTPDVSAAALSGTVADFAADVALTLAKSGQ